MLPRFSVLNFGHLDAREEAQLQPELLTEGYFDYQNAAYGLSTGNTWGILGPKGSGKSAVLENLRLTWQDRHDRFFEYWDLSNFPIADVAEITQDISKGPARARTSWEFLLWLRVVESLNNDVGASLSHEFVALFKRLKRAGFIGSDWSVSVNRWTGGGLGADLKLLQGSLRFNRESVTTLEVSSDLRESVIKSKTDSRHLIAVDGLDSFFFEVSDQWTSLAGLLSAMSTVNHALRGAGLPITVAVAGRSDIIDMVPDPETNKLKEHFIYLDWHLNGIGAKNHLWKLVSTKAAVMHPQVRDITKQYLGRKIVAGELGPYHDISQIILDNTRLLPRDIVALLSHLQKVHTSEHPVHPEKVKRALERYCEEYFIGEIFNNLAGILPSNRARELSSFQDALRASPSRLFTMDYMTTELRGELEPSEIKKLLKQLFEVGGIGVKSGEHTDFTFRRTSGGAFTTRGKFMLHDALTRAWNKPWRDKS
ncbi:hypothetical protein GCM10009674_04120 [Nesterenkonia xinjiangensis]